MNSVFVVTVHNGIEQHPYGYEKDSLVYGVWSNPEVAKDEIIQRVLTVIRDSDPSQGYFWSVSGEPHSKNLHIYVHNFFSGGEDALYSYSIEEEEVR